MNIYKKDDMNFAFKCGVIQTLLSLGGIGIGIVLIYLFFITGV